jgi:hypothetical protein
METWLLLGIPDHLPCLNVKMMINHYGDDKPLCLSLKIILDRPKLAQNLPKNREVGQ